MTTVTIAPAPWAKMVGMSAAGSSRVVEPEGTGESGLAALIARSATGDQAAFADLYDATAPRVHGLVRRLLRDDAQAEEVTQEVFLDVWRSCGRFEPERGSAIGWLLTVAHRKSVDRIRSVSAARVRDERFEREATVPEHDSTAEAVTGRAEATRLHTVLRTLTGAQREAIELAYFDGATQAQVAERLGIPLGTAKTRIRDGLRALRDRMGGTRP